MRAVARTTQDSLAQRAFAARWAMSFLSLGVSFSALALPPFMPPNLPRATAAAFFFFFGKDSTRVDGVSGSPIACSTTLRAVVIKSSSLVFLLERLGIIRVCHK
jgi:hypothetical protein